MLNFSHMESCLEAIPSLEADENIHILKIYILLVKLQQNISSSLYMCLSKPTDLYPCCLAIHTYIEKVSCVSWFVKKRRACNAVSKTPVQKYVPPSETEVTLISRSPPSSGGKRDISPRFCRGKKGLQRSVNYLIQHVVEQSILTK